MCSFFSLVFFAGVEGKADIYELYLSKHVFDIEYFWNLASQTVVTMFVLLECSMPMMLKSVKRRLCLIIVINMCCYVTS